MTVLIPILGDQLSHDLASMRDVDRGEAVVLMMEVAEETTYVRHHQRKIALVLSAMRHFAEELAEDLLARCHGPVLHGVSWLSAGSGAYR